MEWLKALSGLVVGLDTAPLIYFIEENHVYLPLVRPFFEAVDRGEFQVVTSVLTLTEVLVHPLRRGDHRLAEQHRQILLHARIPVMSVRYSGGMSVGAWRRWFVSDSSPFLDVPLVVGACP